MSQKMPSTDMQVTQIGVVRTNAKSRSEVRRGGGQGVIEVFEPFWPALDQIEFNSHLMLFGWFHLSNRTVLRTKPRKVAPFAHERGVFACRSPDRPTPIAMTIVPLVERQDHHLIVDDLDFVDGTPLVDIKPYCPGWDSVFSATHRRRANPNLQDDELLREFYARDFINHVGRQAKDSEVERLSVEACLLATRHFQCDPRDEKLQVSLSSVSPMLDGLMAITGASLTNGRLHIGNGVEGMWAGTVVDSCFSQKVLFRRQNALLELTEDQENHSWRVTRAVFPEGTL